jgi:hypothetical protein
MPEIKEHELPVVAWRYQDSHGHYRYRGPREGFDTEYAILKPFALTSHQAATEAIKELKGRLEASQKLAAFGAWCAREFRDHLADVDGGSAQDAMERLGVIVKRVVTEPCGEGCVCAGYGDFPHDCYVFPDEVSAAIDRALSLEGGGET